MKISDFSIGTEFTVWGKTYRCTDVGSRVVIAIRIDEMTMAAKQGDTISHQILSRTEAEQQGWFDGPPYAVAEHVIDEDDLEACEMVLMSPPNNPTIAKNEWNNLREAAALGYQDAVLSLAMVETVKRWDSPECKATLEEANAGRAAQLVIDGLLFRLHMFITRAFLPVRYEDDRHLKTAIEFLEREASLNNLQDAHDPERLKRAISAFNAVAQDGRLKRLKKMRNKQLAHMASYKEQNRPTINDLFEMAKLSSDIWENLAIGSAVILIDVEIQLRAYRRSADIFWSKWDGNRSTSDDDGEDLFPEEYLPQ
ncbi:AbiU2 domain-containing protein [Phyllobacterium calauticae]|jgi:AbiU2|uniref:AbiU2 domain-containing protein n=1 Tax=Phyllobacterium calauticae TaxID=2817027 RepID=UPI001CBFBD18|nr:hypothetical protein [Phyllobacterium calauticae]MBZ3693262.1 hypothetical protein [Phyllobacterium calauticae]